MVRLQERLPRLYGALRQRVERDLADAVAATRGLEPGQEALWRLGLAGELAWAVMLFRHPQHPTQRWGRDAPLPGALCWR